MNDTYVLYCTGDDPNLAAVRGRAPTGCAYITALLPGNIDQYPTIKRLAESGDYYKLVPLARQHERETGHQTEIRCYPAHCTCSNMDSGGDCEYCQGGKQ